MHLKIWIFVNVVLQFNVCIGKYHRKRIILNPYSPPVDTLQNGEFRPPEDVGISETAKLSQELVRYNTCDPNIEPILYALGPLHRDGYTGKQLQKLCSLLSFPNLREVLGPYFSFSWFPTVGKLLKAIFNAALKSQIVRNCPSVLETIAFFRDSVLTSGPGSHLVDLSKMAAPIGILPPASSKDEFPLKDILDPAVTMGLNESSVALLHSLFTSGKLNQFVDKDFDASYFTTYEELIGGIYHHIPNKYEPIKLLFLAYFYLVQKTVFGQRKFNPVLLYELNLPPVSQNHDPFIKEFVYTTIHPKYNASIYYLEENLNNGYMLESIGTFDLLPYRTKGQLLKDIITKYVLSLYRELDPFIYIGNSAIKFLEDKVNLSGGGLVPVEPELVAALLGVRKQLFEPECKRHAEFLLESVEFTRSLTIKPLCNFLNSVDIYGLFGPRFDPSLFSNNGKLLHAMILSAIHREPNWSILKPYVNKIRYTGKHLSKEYILTIQKVHNTEPGRRLIRK